MVNFFGGERRYVPYHLCLNIERLRNTNHFIGVGFGQVHLQAMPHVEYLVHLAPAGLAFFLNQAEQRRGVEQIVFNNMEALDKVQPPWFARRRCNEPCRAVAGASAQKSA